ncbi:MAG: hypothetical protein VKL60_04690 [Sphaerospermopsis sp.]|nr:hypothetical protein [Sphaerospermopsis sp.]
MPSRKDFLSKPYLGEVFNNSPYLISKNSILEMTNQLDFYLYSDRITAVLKHLSA